MKIKIICLLLAIFFITGCLEAEKIPVVKITEKTIKKISYDNNCMIILFFDNNYITVKKSKYNIYEGQKGVLFLSGPKSYIEKYVYIWKLENNTKLEMEECVNY